MLAGDFKKCIFKKYMAQGAEEVQNRNRKLGKLPCCFICSSRSTAVEVAP